MRGRVKGRIYSDMLVRGIKKTEARLAKVLADVNKFNAQSKKYEHKPVPTKLLAKVQTCANVLKEAGAKVSDL